MYRVLVSHLDLTELVAFTPKLAVTIVPHAVVIGINKSVIAVMASLDPSASPSPNECIMTKAVVATR